MVLSLTLLELVLLLGLTSRPILYPLGLAFAVIPFTEGWERLSVGALLPSRVRFLENYLYISHLFLHDLYMDGQSKKI